MAERKARGGSRAARGAKRRSDVIDVDGAERPDDGEHEPEPERDGEGEAAGEGEEDKEKEESDDDFLAAASQVIDVGDDGSVHSGEWPVPEEKERDEDAKRSRGGSLVKRDPLQAYMVEARRYPLLTPQEE